MRNSFNKSRINQSTLFNAKAMLYPYQNETVDNIDKLMEEGFNFRGQVILPTGAGKSYTVFSFIHNVLIQKKTTQKILFVTSLKKNLQTS